MADRLNGIIIKGIGGFYYVEAADAIYECKAKGTFRKNRLTPTVGDRVTIETDPNGYDFIVSIEERRNILVRPPLANIDNLFIVMSVRKPDYSTLITDRLTAIAEHKRIKPVIVVNKSDLAMEEAGQLVETYRRTGYDAILTCAGDGSGVDEIKKLLAGSVSAFTGNSGVGKSSILNLIDEKLSLSTGEISEKLGRGRHTTRHVELFRLECGGYVADTPGFSSLDLENSEIIMKDELQYCFPEFEPYLGKCRFTSCAHINDLGCAVVEAVNEGKIMRSRHESYKALYEEVKNIKEYELRNK